MCLHRSYCVREIRMKLVSFWLKDFTYFCGLWHWTMWFRKYIVSFEVTRQPQLLHEAQGPHSWVMELRMGYPVRYKQWNPSAWFDLILADL